MLIVAPPSPSLVALVLFPQPPVQVELFGSSPVLSFTSLMEELQVAVAEQELEESALPESFLLASSKADATSILLRQGLFFGFEDSFLSKVYSSVLRFLPRRGFVQI